MTTLGKCLRQAFRGLWGGGQEKKEVYIEMKILLIGGGGYERFDTPIYTTWVGGVEVLGLLRIWLINMAVLNEMLCFHKM